MILFPAPSINNKDNNGYYGELSHEYEKVKT